MARTEWEEVGGGGAEARQSLRGHLERAGLVPNMTQAAGTESSGGPQTPHSAR